MKRLILTPAFLLALMAVLFTSCKDDKEDMLPQKEKSIVEIVVDSDDFSMLEAAVVRAGLVETLSGNGPFTVFAPNNAAFKAAGFPNEAAVAAAPVETLKAILLYHVLGSKVVASSIPNGNNTAVETAGGEDLFVTKSNAGVYVNGSMVTQADIMAKNGVVHVIKNVLMPPMGNVVETLASKSEFSLLVAAVVRASQGSVNVKAALEGTGPLTVFAPTNQAFINAGFANVAAIQAADPATLTSILTYHVVGSRVFSSALTNGLSTATLNGGNIVFNLTGGATVKGASNTTASKITGTDIMVDNGVIHVIDQVLLP